MPYLICFTERVEKARSSSSGFNTDKLRNFDIDHATKYLTDEAISRLTSFNESSSFHASSSALDGQASNAKSSQMTSLANGLQAVALEQQQDGGHDNNAMDVFEQPLEQDTSMHVEEIAAGSGNNESSTEDDENLLQSSPRDLPEECSEDLIGWNHGLDHNVVQFWDSREPRRYRVRHFSKTNDAASTLCIAVSDEEGVTSRIYIRFIFNWWAVSAAVKSFKCDDKMVKKVFFQRCMVYRKSTGDYPYFIMQVFISTCNRPILGMYLCDLEQAKDPRNLGTGNMFFLLKHSKFCFILQ
jgi:hypothetical protein